MEGRETNRKSCPPALTLSPRLQVLADWVRQDAAVADIGTDHAFLPVWLQLHRRVRFAIASDLRCGPLSRARETGRRYGADGIDYRLCSGLSDIGSEEVDTIVIAGMGGENMVSILAAAPWTADGRHTLLLQPMTHCEEVRNFLQQGGFAITREAFVHDRGTIYAVLEASAGRMRLTPGQLLGGARLSPDPLQERYIIEKIVRLHMALAGAKRSGRSADIEKANALRDGVTALQELWEEWRHANSAKN